MVTFAQNDAWTQDAATQYGRQTGLLKPGETATGGLLMRRAQEAGQVDALNNAITSYADPAPVAGTAGGSFVPMHVDPLHQFEKNALQEMANPGALDGGSMGQANQYLQQLLKNLQPTNPNADKLNRQAVDYSTQAGGLVNQSVQPITIDEVEERRNPYAAALKDRLKESGAIARQEIQATQGLRGGRSFGDVSQGRRESYLDAELHRGRGEIDYRTYDDAYNQLQAMRNRQSQGGNIMGNLAQGAQGIASSGANTAIGAANSLFNAGRRMTSVGRDNQQQALSAGRYIRRYNQGINDMIANNILASIADDPSRINQVLQMLAGFGSGQQNVLIEDPGTLRQVGGGLTALSGGIETLSNAGVF